MAMFFFRQRFHLQKTIGPGFLFPKPGPKSSMVFLWHDLQSCHPAFAIEVRHCETNAWANWSESWVKPTNWEMQKNISSHWRIMIFCWLFCIWRISLGFWQGCLNIVNSTGLSTDVWNFVLASQIRIRRPNASRGVFDVTVTQKRHVLKGKAEGEWFCILCTKMWLWVQGQQWFALQIKM